MAVKKTRSKKAKVLDIKQADIAVQQRLENLDAFKRGRPTASSFAVVTRKTISKNSSPNPIVTGIGDRSTPKATTWILASDRMRIGKAMTDGEFTSENLPGLVRRVKKKIDEETDYINSYYGHYGVILPEYDQYEPYTLVDTEAYFLQAIRRRQSLMFRNGFKLSGDNRRFVSYASRRLEQITYVMGTTVDSFLKDILWNLMVVSNCFLLKIRDEEASGGTPNEKNEKKKPVAAYVIIPPYQMFPYVNEKSQILKWRRYYGSARKYKDHKISDVIHFKWDVKPGHLYGTPCTIALRDDVFALRRLEENVELLLINHLFPLFHVKVGTKEAPATYHPEGVSEVDLIKSQIENMPKEGVFVTDERVAVDVTGIEGEFPDPGAMIEHYKKRIFTGLGVAGLDMGEVEGASRSGADNVSQNLKDTVKSQLADFCGQFKMLVLKELFEENPTDLSVQNAVIDVGLLFPEIDIDQKIKVENHALQLYLSNGIDTDELRRRIHEQPYEKKQLANTHYETHVVDLVWETARAKAANPGPITTKSASGVTKVNTKAGSTPNPVRQAASQAGTVANRNMPANQHGKNLDPHKGRSSMEEEFFSILYDNLIVERKRRTEEEDDSSWTETITPIVNDITNSFVNKDTSDPYTIQFKEAISALSQSMLDMIATTDDPDILHVLLTDMRDTITEELNGKFEITDKSVQETTSESSAECPTELPVGPITE